MPKPGRRRRRRKKKKIMKGGKKMLRNLRRVRMNKTIDARIARMKPRVRGQCRGRDLRATFLSAPCQS